MISFHSELFSKAYYNEVYFKMGNLFKKKKVLYLEHSHIVDTMNYFTNLFTFITEQPQ